MVPVSWRKPKASGMDSGWCDDLWNRFAEARASILTTARSGPSISPSNASSLPPERRDHRASSIRKIGNHENHPSAAKLHLFSNHRVTVFHVQQTDEAHAKRTKRS